jgi:GYF domain 2
MSAPQSHQWYIARDGQQFGPLTEAELAKFIDLGHMQPTDLLWREGFTDWRPALVVFPQRNPPAPKPPPSFQPSQPLQPMRVVPPRATGRPEPEQQHRPAAREPVRLDPGALQSRRRDQHPDPSAGQMEAEDVRPRRGGGLRRVMLILVVLALLGAGGLFAYPYRGDITDLVKGLAAGASSGLDRAGMATPPLKGFVGTDQAVDTTLQATPLWRLLKRDFPDWYTERLKEVSGLASQNKDDAAIAQQMARGLVALRRQNVNHALAASFPRLKAIATTFHENLVALRKQSSEACFEFISQGEASPTIVGMLRGSEQVAPLQAQLTAVFEAVVDGRKQARVYPQPRKTDYDALAADLRKLGWSQGDMQLFSDERELARASPQKVCQLVHDWFTAQLAIKDPDMQLRLLVDSLKPVVAG